METGSGIGTAISLLPGDIAAELESNSLSELNSADEIRLRIGRPVTLTKRGNRAAVGTERRITRADIDTVVSRAFRNSLHSSTEQLCAGFVTCENGCRVGIAGTASAEKGTVLNVRHISSVCIRIPREVKGCATEIFERCFSDRASSVLIYGAPSAGKTTFLRDLTRLCGNEYRTALIDERGEIAASVSGNPTNDVGLLTDVFDRYPRSAAIQTAVRVMNPQIIVCDEIGNANDIEDLTYAMNSGVKLTATCHSGSPEELRSKKYISALIAAGVFEYLVFLKECRIAGISRVCTEQSAHC